MLDPRDRLNVLSRARNSISVIDRTDVLMRRDLVRRNTLGLHPLLEILLAKGLSITSVVNGAKLALLGQCP